MLQLSVYKYKSVSDLFVCDPVSVFLPDCPDASDSTKHHLKSHILSLNLYEYERIISTQTENAKGSSWAVCYVSKHGSWWRVEFIVWDKGSILIGSCGKNNILQQHSEQVELKYTNEIEQSSVLVCFFFQFFA